MARDRFRVRFRKGGDLRLISHHDLMRTFERMLRRAAIPVHCSEGFNPKPRVAFALSLALGVVGCQEVAELELDDSMEAEDLCRLLAREAPAGLDILSVKRVNCRAQVRRTSYRVPLSPSQAPSVETRIREILAASHCWRERKKAGARPIDLRASISKLRTSPGYLEMDLWVLPNGTARPEEILQVLGVTGWLEEGSVIERTALELEDEQPTPIFSIDTDVGNETAALDRCAASGSLGTQLEGSS
jgi:radical SAM-linked protein